MKCGLTCDSFGLTAEEVPWNVTYTESNCITFFFPTVCVLLINLLQCKNFIYYYYHYY